MSRRCLLQHVPGSDWTGVAPPGSFGGLKSYTVDSNDQGRVLCFRDTSDYEHCASARRCELWIQPGNLAADLVCDSGTPL